MPDGNISKGITVLGGDTIIEFPFVLKVEEAKKLHEALLAAESLALPCRHSVRFSWYSYLSFKFNKYTESWPGGGGITGWVGLSLYGKLWPGTMSIASITQLRKGIFTYCELGNESKPTQVFRT